MKRFFVAVAASAIGVGAIAAGVIASGVVACRRNYVDAE